MCARVDERARPGARLREQLERRLAVAVLEVLLAQPMAVRAQQHLAPGLRHQRHLLHLVEASRAVGGQASSSARFRLRIG